MRGGDNSIEVAELSSIPTSFVGFASWRLPIGYRSSRYWDRIGLNLLPKVFEFPHGLPIVYVFPQHVEKVSLSEVEKVVRHCQVCIGIARKCYGARINVGDIPELWARSADSNGSLNGQLDFNRIFQSWTTC